MQAAHERVKALIRELEWFVHNMADPEVAQALSAHVLTLAGESGTFAADGIRGSEVGRGQAGYLTRDSFSARQLAILQGMVEGKTNHDLASDLGFSVSTIRHETMRIYQILGVSDRREAAREALDQGIL